MSIEPVAVNGRPEGPRSSTVPDGWKVTDAGVIPNDWEPRPLLKAVAVAVGQVDPRKEPFRSLVLVAPDHIESSTGRLLQRLSAWEQHAISGKYLFSPGDVVYSKIRPYLRKAIKADFHGLCSADVYPLKPVADVASGFIFAVLLGHRFSVFAESVSARSGIPKINREELAQFVVALPPLPEQQAVAAVLSDVDGLIGALDQLIAKKRAIKLATAQQLFTGKTRLLGSTGTWGVTTLGTLCRSITDGTHFTPSYVVDGVPFYSVENVTADNFTNPKFISVREHAQLTRRCKPEKGDILLTRIGALGETKLIDWDVDASIYVSLALLKVKEDIDSRYLYCYTKSRKFLEDLEARALLNASPKKINMGDIGSVPVPVPEIREQRAIATVLSDMDAELVALQRRRDKTKSIKQGMMQALLTGQIRLLERGGTA
jgi:type I restriction enzyme S subunit